MRSRRWTRQFVLRFLGIIPLILGLGHTPLPVADYHNIRHHDRPGQVCEYHDHLLRWHPHAKEAEDVVVFHWHWILPLGDADSVHPDQGPAIHAHTADRPVSGWDDAPQIAAEAQPRVVERGGTGAELDGPFPPDLGAFDLSMLRAGPPWPVRAFSASYPARIGLPTLLQRWTC